MSRLRFPQYIALTALAFAGFSVNSYAEKIAVPIGQQQDSSVQVPGQSWTQEKVEQNFGAPLSRRGPVGEPAIYVWNYGEFSVYFENDRVIHSVVHYVDKG